MTKTKRIIPKYGNIQKIAAKFNISTFTVRKALRYDESVQLGEYIRQEAIERGGFIVDKIKN